MPQTIPPLEDLLEDSYRFQAKALKILTVSCPQCGVFFTPTRKWQRFCSDRCRKLSFKAEKSLQQLKDSQP